MTVSNDILEIGLFASLQFADCTDNGKGRQAALATLCRFLLATSLVQCSTVQYSAVNKGSYRSILLAVKVLYFEVCVIAH